MSTVMKRKTSESSSPELKIHPELQSLLPSHTSEEQAGLEANILRNGCLEAICVWNNVIVDGHQRYAICRKHGLPFKTESMTFESLDDAMNWRLLLHLNQRNLTEEEYSQLQKEFKEYSPKLGSIAIQAVRISPHRRATDPQKVRELAESIAWVGLLNPITVTQDDQLVAGAHRLEACRQLDWDVIPCLRVDGESFQLELSEIDENLIRNDLDDISIGELALRRDEILEKMGLRANVGGNGSNQHQSKGASGAPLPKTTKAIAKEIGISKRTLQENKQLAKNLVPEAKEVVRKEEITKKEALKLARMEPERQKELVERIQSGEVKNVREAELCEARQKVTDQTVEVTASNPPVIYVGDGIAWIQKQPPCDLLLTDPPYSTDVQDIDAFAASWLPMALSRVKPTGMAYVFIGAYPKEQHAYTGLELSDHIRLEQILVWSYKNTLGNNPKDRYKLNWQAILFYRGVDAPALDCPLTAEQWAVMEVNAPDGRLGNRYHTWQKPMELAERLIRHSTSPGDLVYDPFACTGTFLLAAAKLGRIGFGAEINPDHAAIAIERGCCYASSSLAQTDH